MEGQRMGVTRHQQSRSKASFFPHLPPRPLIYANSPLKPRNLPRGRRVTVTLLCEEAFVAWLVFSQFSNDWSTHQCPWFHQRRRYLRLMASCVFSGGGERFITWVVSWWQWLSRRVDRWEAFSPTTEEGSAMALSRREDRESRVRGRENRQRVRQRNGVRVLYPPLLTLTLLF